MTSRCSFCTKDADSVGTLVAGAGVFICNECVDLCAQLVKDKKDAGPLPRVPVWEQVDDDGVEIGPRAYLLATRLSGSA